MSAGPGGAILVVAAIIERDGKILIGQRRAGGWGEFQWEFPGGKVEPYESPSEALARELREELDIQAGVGVEITRYGHQYPGRPPIQLIFYRITRFEGEPRNLAFQQIRWEEPRRLSAYDFLEGDADFVRRIAQDGFGE
jgi:mutator protein MutT